MAVNPDYAGREYPPAGPFQVTAEQITDWWARSVTGRTSRSHIDLGGLGVVAHLAAQLLPAASASAPVSVPALQEVSRHVG